MEVVQQRQQAQELGRRARITVREDQRRSVVPRRPHVQEVHGLPVDHGRELRIRIEPCLGRGPVEALPAGGQRTKASVRYAPKAGGGVGENGPASRRQLITKAGDVGRRNLDAEGKNAHTTGR
jgi:hypothetical protein